MNRSHPSRLPSPAARPAPPEADTPAPILVLGLGNDVLTDDAVGLVVAQAVREALDGEPTVQVEITTEMGLALLDFMADRWEVIIIDSIQTGQACPGTIHEFNAESLQRVTGRTPHFLGVGETLALGSLVGLTMPGRVRIVAIEVEDPFTLGTNLTPAVRAAVPIAADRVVEVCREAVARTVNGARPLIPVGS